MFSYRDKQILSLDIAFCHRATVLVTQSAADASPSKEKRLCELLQPLAAMLVVSKSFGH